MKWRFIPWPKGIVEQDVTQWDQFKNDDVDLADSLGRESTQNSLDASVGDGPVRLRFSYLRDCNAPDHNFLKKLFDSHTEHAQAAGINLDRIDFSKPTALVIEDFGTQGLTGKIDEKDDGNFSDFWRRHGRSHKTGKSLGRWGLGKLVFSMSSQLRAFFGLTVQADTGAVALMGQTVLGMHYMNGKEYTAHSFFSDMKDPDSLDALQIPISDKNFVEQFRTEFRLARKKEPGLSVVIPFPVAGIDRDVIIEVVIINYFIPVLRRQLVIEFDEVTIDHNTILDHAQKFARGKIKDIEDIFAFVKEADAAHIFTRPTDSTWYRNGRLGAEGFAEGDLSAMRDAFTNGKLVSVELPIAIQKSGKEAENGFFRLFLKKPESISHGQDFYVRGGITLPQEAKFRDRKALGMLIADEPVVATFLGDAENASHTKWNGKAEKLKDYKAADTRLKAIRNSLVELLDHLMQAIEEENEKALLNFFWTPGEGIGPKEKVQNEIKKTPPPIPPPSPEHPPIRISECVGGVSILPGRVLSPEELPLNIVVELAYDVSQGNPFRLYSAADFDLGDEEEINIEIDGGVNVEAAQNTLRCSIKEPSFSVHLTGFDDKRDLIVRVED